jgi:hypothetical protein
MDNPATKIQILNLIETEHEALQVVMRPLAETQLIQSGVEGELSVKDILAHITAWEQRMVQWVDESLQGKTPERPAPGKTWDDVDELNKQVYLANKDRPLVEVQADFAASYQQSIKAVAALSQADLFDPHRFAWRKGDPLWQMIAANTWLHYREHRLSISRWLAG